MGAEVSVKGIEFTADSREQARRNGESEGKTRLAVLCDSGIAARIIPTKG